MTRRAPEQFERFEDWEEAFSVCRERDHPMRAQVGLERGTVFPSGSFRRAHEKEQGCDQAIESSGVAPKPGDCLDILRGEWD